MQILQYGLEERADSGLLHAALGIIDIVLVISGTDADESRVRGAERHLDQARAVEPDALHTHLLAGAIAWTRGRPQEAVSEYRQALLKDPNHPEALVHLGLLYGTAGRAYAASPLASRVLEVDPFSAAHHALKGFLMELEGNFENGMRECRLAFELDPCPPAILYYAMALARSGDPARACTLLDTMSQSGAGVQLLEMGAFMRHALAGDSEDALRTLTPGLETYARFVHYHPWQLAAGLALIGDLDRAFVWLRHAMTLGFIHYPFLLIDPLLANMREDPRWPALAEDVRRQWQEFEV